MRVKEIMCTCVYMHVNVRECGGRESVHVRVYKYHPFVRESSADELKSTTMKEMISKNKFLRKPSESRTTCSPAVNRDVLHLESGNEVSFNTVHFVQQIYRTIKGVRGCMFVHNRERDYSID